MARANTLFRPAFTVVSALALALAAAGCNPQVSGGGDGGDGGSGGSGGDGGSGGSSSSSSSTTTSSSSTSSSSTGTPTPTMCVTYAGDGCAPGDTQECPEYDIYHLTMGCFLTPDKPCTTHWDWSNCNTPLVLSFDNTHVEYVTGSEHGFTVNGLQSLVTDWPTSKTPWLALDRDSSGTIDDGTELFGSMSPLASGATAANGFLALRELDTNGDGRITPEDPAFSKLLVWSDKDGNRRSASSELVSAESQKLLSIDLAYTVSPHCDARGNCEIERASFRYLDETGTERTGAVIDVHFAPQN